MLLCRPPLAPPVYAREPIILLSLYPCLIKCRSLTTITIYDALALSFQDVVLFQVATVLKLQCLEPRAVSLQRGLLYTVSTSESPFQLHRLMLYCSCNSYFVAKYSPEWVLLVLLNNAEELWYCTVHILLIQSSLWGSPYLASQPLHNT